MKLSQTLFVSVLSLFLSCTSIFAQVPQKISYQAIIRNASNQVVSNQQVGMKISILLSSETGIVLYSEKHSPTTNSNGLVSVIVGDGTDKTGDFSAIVWGSKPFYLKSETDPSGGTNYSMTITSQILSVPYALHAESANSVLNETDPSVPIGTQQGEMQYWDGSKWVTIEAGEYGQALIFCNNVPTWGGCLAKVTTNSPAQVYSTAIHTSGNITNEGGLTVTQRGICWATNSNPTIENNQGIATSGNGIGVFSILITGLSPNTTYHYRAFATNNAGTAYGDIIQATTPAWYCGNDILDERDGNVYTTIIINNQCWMSKNLAFLPIVHNDTQFQTQGNNSQPGYGVYGYTGTNVADAKVTANYITYGVLYNWFAAMNGAASSTANPSGVQGVCPAEWHLPSDAEWTQLTNYLGGINVAGGKMKSTGTTHWNSPNADASNSSGFSALPGSYRQYNGTFENIGFYGYWWSATEYSELSVNSSWSRGLQFHNGSVNRSMEFNTGGFSVRCVKD